MHARTTLPTRTTRQDRHGWSRWHLTWSFAIVVGLGLALLSPSTVQARTFQCRARDVACLITSITQANVQPGPRHEIRLEAGTYTLVDAYEKDLTAGWSGLPSITGNLTIRGAGADLTVIERSINAYVFRLINVAATCTLALEGLTLRGGRFIWAGAIANAGGTVTINDSILADNSGSVGSGGAIENGGTLTITNSLLVDNGAGGSGGAIFNSGTVTIANSSLAGNVAFWGGGAIVNQGMLAITDSTLARNLMYAEMGGSGGAIGNGGTLTLINSTLFDNVADYASGGAIGNSGTLTIISSTLARNAARKVFPSSGNGGAIANYGTLTLLNSTLAGNTAENTGGGLTAGGTVYMQNTILAQNTASGSSPDCANLQLVTLISQGYNLIGNLDGCTVTSQPTDRAGDPGLGNFRDDETPGDAHYPLLFTSQAINRGNPAACPKTDQLGQNRVGTCDIGAIEFQGTAVSSR
jgi:hypothetical protein